MSARQRETAATGRSSGVRPGPGEPERSTLARWAPPLATLALILITLAVYWGGVRGEFIGADHALFTRSPLTAPPGESGALPIWLPRTTQVLSLALDRAIWGPLPAGFRTTNLLLHVLATVFLFALFRRWTRCFSIALGAALLFAVHPLHVAAIEVVGARGEILGTIFVVLALTLLEREREARNTAAPIPSDRGTPRGAAAAFGGSAPADGTSGVLLAGSPIVPLVLAVLCYIAATFASPVALVLPLVLALTDWIGSMTAPQAAAGGSGSGPYGRRVWLSLAAASIPAAIAWLALAPPAAPINRWLMGRAALLSIKTMFVPSPLHGYWILGPASGADAVSLLTILASLGILGAFAYLAVRAAANRPYVTAVLLTAVPVVALCALPPASPGPDAPFALIESSLYLPSAGACLVLTALFAALAGIAGASEALARTRAALLVSVVVAVPFIVLSLARIAVYRSDVTLLAAEAAAEPQSSHLRIELARSAAAHGQTGRAIDILKPVAAGRPGDAGLHLLLGNLLRDSGDLDQAEQEAREALRLDPSLAGAYVTLGLIERERGDPQAAEANYREALKLDPNLAEAHSNLGALLVALGAPDQALVEMRRAVELDPASGDAAANLAHFLLAQKQPQEALAVLKRALRYSESDSRLYYNLGVLLQQQGDESGAVEAYLDAIRLDPTYARPKNNLATLYAKQKKYDLSIGLLQQLIALEPNNEQAHFNLGIAYRAVGDTKQAAAEFAAALRLRPNYPEASRALSELFSPGGTRPGS